MSAAPSTLVDIGCGQGACSRLVGANIEYVGVDASNTLIKRANDLYGEAAKRFVRGDVYKLPLADSSADAVMSVWVWSHLESLPNATTEMARILKPGGKFLVINANPDTYEERKGFYTKYEMKGDVLVGDFDLGEGKVLSNSTLYFHSRDEMTGALESSGLNIDDTATLGYKETYPQGLYIAISGHKTLKP